MYLGSGAHHRSREASEPWEADGLRILTVGAPQGTGALAVRAYVADFLVRVCEVRDWVGHAVQIGG